MKRSLTLTALLVMALSTAACGGGETQQSERATPSQEKQVAPATQSAPTEKNAPEESTPSESAQGAEGSEAAGLSVRTLEGERVSLEGQGDVTALYFMAGW